MSTSRQATSDDDATSQCVLLHKASPPREGPLLVSTTMPAEVPSGNETTSSESTGAQVPAYEENWARFGVWGAWGGRKTERRIPTSPKQSAGANCWPWIAGSKLRSTLEDEVERRSSCSTERGEARGLGDVAPPALTGLGSKPGGHLLGLRRHYIGTLMGVVELVKHVSHGGTDPVRPGNGELRSGECGHAICERLVMGL